MRRRILYSASNNGKPISNANYADICYYDANNDEFIIVDVADIDNYTDARYTPIGIVAVPSSHTDEGRPCIMSLVHMSCDTPTSGSTSPQGMCYGHPLSAVYDLPLKRYFPYISSSSEDVTPNSLVQFSYSTSNLSTFLPSDANGENGTSEYFTEINPSNTNEHFYVWPTSNILMCSPYKQDGSKDLRYFEEPTIEGDYSPLADFDGRSNTDKILNKRGSKDYSTWKPTNTDYNDNPAASCCDMFYTVGTNQGEWYLPSAGELGYAIARMQAIQNSLKILLDKGYKIGLINTDSYWSSTQGANQEWYCAIRASFDVGLIGTNEQNDLEFVRAFLKL